MKRKKRYANFSDSDAGKLSGTSSGLTTGSGSNKSGSSGFWDSLFSNSGSILSGLGQGIASILGKDTTTDSYQTQYSSDSSQSSIGFGTIFLYGGGALILILLLVLFMKK